MRQKGSKKIAAKLNYISLFNIYLTAIIVIVIMFISSSQIINHILKDDTQLAVLQLVNSAKKMEADALSLVKELTTNYGLKSALTAADKSSTQIAINTIKDSTKSNVEFITIFDKSGNLIGQQGKNELSDQGNTNSFKAALANQTATYYEVSSDNQMAITATAPIKNSSGQIIAVAATGYQLANTELVDGLKASMGTEFTVFANDVRINTTIMQDNQRQIGTKLNEKVAQIVLTEKSAFAARAEILGFDYYTAYEPILNSQGEAVGIFFAGKPIEEINKVQNQGLLLSFLAIGLASVLLMIINRRVTSKMVANPVIHMSELAASIARGELNHQAINFKSNDEIGNLREALESMANGLRNMIGDIKDNLSLMAQGDMTVKIDKDYPGDFNQIKEAVNQIVASLNDTLSTIYQASDQVNAGADQVAQAAQGLSQGATEQASAIQELTASVTEISSEVNRNAGNVRQATDYVEQAVAGVGNSNQQMQEMLQSMNDISSTSGQISNIIKVIDDIAFQTNILALNAAVEAARAGQAGKGFAVVADEVRNLAIKSADAAKQTTVLIESSIRAVKQGSQSADNTARAMEDVAVKSNLVKDIIAEIDKASSEQATSIAEIMLGIEQISGVVQTNSATAEESAAASEELSSQATMLNEQIQKFRLTNTDQETYSTFGDISDDYDA